MSLVDWAKWILFRIHFKVVRDINNLKLIFISTDVPNVGYIELSFMYI